MTVFTIGYEGLNLDRFMLLLAKNGVDTLVDVRAVPISRKPGFSKRALSGALQLAGIDYVHMVQLGCPKPVRDGYREDGNWKRYTVGFLQHLQSQQAAIAELSARVQQSSCALMCFEADYRVCHRSIVANAVREDCGADLRHIQVNAKKAIPASLELALA